MPAKPFKVLNCEDEKFPFESYCTIDIETVNIDGKQVPYLICADISTKIIHQYAEDLSPEAQADMFHNFFTELTPKKLVRIISNS